MLAKILMTSGSLRIGTDPHNQDGWRHIRLNLSGVIHRRVFLENLEILLNTIHRRFFPTDFPSATDFLKVKSLLPQ
jgi:hypothetical protein